MAKEKTKKGGKKKAGSLPYNVVDKQQKGSVPPRLWQRYREEIVDLMVKEFGYCSKMQVPCLSKITLNMGLGDAVTNPNIIKTAAIELTQIAGQRSVVTKARKSISNFKLREGVPIGCMVTLRRARMWEFFDRFIAVAMPRMRDFKGVSGKSFDGRGNYSLGLREQIIFPEIDYDQVEQVTGMNVTITTTAINDQEGKSLLKHLGMPFRN